MTRRIEVEGHGLPAYAEIAPPALLDAVRAAAEPLRGTHVLHLNATGYGGGVAELLQSVIPALRSLGIDAEWRVLEADDDFFAVTKALHNGLQGGDVRLPPDARRAYVETCARTAEELDGYDVVVAHDPQPAGVLPLGCDGNARWLWRCHIDTSTPNDEAWDFLRPFLDGYEAAIFTMREYVPHDLPIRAVDVIPPAIDPLSEKNAHVSREQARATLPRLGIDPAAPLVTQVSRFDPWKDPGGVLAAYRLARTRCPELRLALAGSLADDDPEGAAIYEEIRASTASDPLVHVFTDLTDHQINVLQRASDVCIQKSLREGFGLVVSEAIWKGTPVVAARTGGIPLQMADGAGGILVDDIDGCAEAIVELLADRSLARDLAERGRDRIREHFLLPRLVLNELTLLAGAADGNGASHAGAVARDPACGIALCASPGAEVFCSDDCRDRFAALEEPRPARAVSPAGALLQR